MLYIRLILAVVIANCWPLFAFAATGSHQDCVDNRAIDWKVVGGIAVLDPEARARGDALLDAVARAGGKLVGETAATPSAYQDIVAALVDQGTGPALYMQTLWDRAAERYELPDEVLNPASILIVATFAAGGEGSCVWTINDVQQAQTCTGAAFSIKRANGEYRSRVKVRSDVGATAETCAYVEDRLIVGFGDSYASGEGNPDHPTRWSDVPGVKSALPSKASRGSTLWDRDKRGPLATAPPTADAQWWDNSCHRSLLSQQSLATIAYAARNRHRRVLFLSFACSGATVYDGIVGPRFDAPGVNRPGGLGPTMSTATTQSQIEQALGVLCRSSERGQQITLPTTLPAWRNLRVRGEHPQRVPRVVTVPTCKDFRRAPDALLLTVGGNDVGFGGVGVWAVMPSSDRSGPLPNIVPLINGFVDRGAAKQDFGLVCPIDLREKRCLHSRYTAQGLLGELPGLYVILDASLRASKLADAPVKIQMSYPPVARDETGALCGRLWAHQNGGYHEEQNEPWVPQYNNVLKLRLLGVPIMTVRGDWSFGIDNRISEADCYAVEPKLDRAEMCIIERYVYGPLNRAVAAHAGWTVLAAAALPQDHGLCAADGPLAQELASSNGDEARILALARQQFGWPRYANGWVEAWPSPISWNPYAERQRWFRTATDSALTQTVLDGGTRHAKRKDRLDEAVSGTIHPTLQMHAAMAESIAAALESAVWSSTGL